MLRCFPFKEIVLARSSPDSQIFPRAPWLLYWSQRVDTRMSTVQYSLFTRMPTVLYSPLFIVGYSTAKSHDCQVTAIIHVGVVLPKLLRTVFPNKTARFPTGRILRRPVFSAKVENQIYLNRPYSRHSSTHPSSTHTRMDYTAEPNWRKAG